MDLHATARTLSVLQSLRAANGGITAHTESRAAILAAGLARPGVEKTIASFSVDPSSLQTVRNGAERRQRASDIADLPVLDFQHGIPTTHTRISVPLSQFEPMVPSGPSAKRVDTYKKSMRGESMAIEAAISTEGPVLVASRRHDGAGKSKGRSAGEAGKEGEKEAGDDLLSTLSTTLETNTFPSGQHPHMRSYTAKDVNTFRSHYEAAGDIAIYSASDPELALVQPAGPSNNYDGQVPLSASATANPSLLRVRRALDRLRAQRAASQSGAPAPQTRTTAIGSDRSAALAPHAFPLQASLQFSKPHFSATTKQLIGSLASFRAGLQQIEQRRRQHNAILRRDPSDADVISWDQSLPAGFDSRYPA